MMTSSRYRKDNATIFDVSCEVKKENSDCSLKVLYPLEYSDRSILRSVKQFSFPIDNGRSENEAVQLFTFVLTDAQSLHTFGYCRYTPRTDSCLCIISGFLWVNFFYKLLNQISAVFNNGTATDVDSLLTNAYLLDLPTLGSKLQLNACTPIGRFSERVPDPVQLPTLRDDKFLLEFFNAINERQMIQLYSALLKERRIIFTTTKLSQLSSCVFGISKLFYPFNWQNLFIPILPCGLTDMLMAPMPYLIGVPKETFRKLDKNEFGDVVVMDLDEKTLTSPCDDKLPTEASNFLRNRLKFSSDVFLSDSFCRAFLQTNVLIFGNFTTGFITDSTGSYKWDRHLFVEKQCPSLRPYLHSLIGVDGVQYFERFIEERLAALNEERVIIDEFEREVQSMGVRKYLDRNSGAKPPELLHHAVTSVKENASDVIGVLKDQLQLISVRDKLGTFRPKRGKETQKQYRKRPNSSVARVKSKCKQQINPLSIDTSQFDLNLSSNMTIPTKTRSASPSDAESCHTVADLIDLSEDTNQSTNLAKSVNIFSSPNLQQSDSIRLSSPFDQNSTVECPIAPTTSPPLAPYDSTPSCSSTINKLRINWETFE